MPRVRTCASSITAPPGLRTMKVMLAESIEPDRARGTTAVDSGAAMVDAKPPVFVARHLAKTYSMGEIAVHALTDVSLEIREGEFIVLLGPSGSGKSTLLNILGGLDTPTSGEAFWRDHDLARADEAALTGYRRDHVGFVFQFYNLIPSLTVRENVELVTDIAPRPMAATEAVALVGLGARADHF